MNNNEYMPDKEKMNLFVEFITINPNGSYEEYREYYKAKENLSKILKNL